MSDFGGMVSFTLRASRTPATASGRSILNDLKPGDESVPN